jgi:NADPH-ferrihemoprotein reductase
MEHNETTHGNHSRLARVRLSESMFVMTPDALALASAVILFLSIVALIVLKVLSSGKGSSRKVRSDGKEKGDVGGHELKVVILYGTQTGTSERFAKEVEEEIVQRYGKVVCVETFDLEIISSDRAEDVLLEGSTGDARVLHLFLQSTYGDGEPTDASSDFVYWARDLADDGRMPDLFRAITYCVFGLGNSSYEHYNAAAKLVDKSLHALGASRLLELHLGDDDCTLEDDFQGWREALWNAMERTYGICAEGALSSDGESRSYQVSTASKIDAVAAERVEVEAMSKQPRGSLTSQSSPYAASIVLAKELHSSTSERSCVHIEFDLSGTGINYQHGDHLGVFAENMLPVVQRAAASLKLPLDYSFSLSMPDDAPASLPQPFPTPCTLGTALSRYADLLNPPRKNALAALASVATDGDEKTRLRHLSSSAGKHEYASYITDPNRSLIEVLEAFPSAVPSLGLFFGAVSPRLAPRFYSISSSPLVDPDVISATVAVVRGDTPTGRLHEGVASSYLSRFVPSNTKFGDEKVKPEMKDVRVPIFVRSSTFKLPSDPSVPVVMIGPGTGYAPFRGFIQERAALAKSGKLLGPAHLFFGCRDESKDHIYQTEMADAAALNNLSSLNIAYSRATSGQKLYVQDKLMSSAKVMYDIMKGKVGGNEGTIYVCGDAKGMARDVHRAIHSILMSEGEYAAHEAEEIVKRLADNGRYHKDVW